MTNQLQTLPNLPSHLAALFNNSAFANVGKAAAGGLNSGGGSHPSISIKQSRWRINEPDLEEEVVQQLYLDVIIVNANEHLSKVYYDKPYNPKAEPEAPPCFADNGVAPSVNASKPQSATCAACPHNVWGSKVTPTGKKARACGDYKKIAVVLADELDSPVFELRIPGASLKEYGQQISKLVNAGIPVPFIVFRLTFDPSADYPKIVFTPTQYASPEQTELVKKWASSEEAKQVVGAYDKPITTLPQLAVEQVPNTPQVQVPQSQPVVQQPLPTPAPFVQNPPVEPQPEKRTRRKRTENAASAQSFAATTAPAAMVQSAPASTTAGFDMPGGQLAASAVPVNPQVTDADLDAILGNALSI